MADEVAKPLVRVPTGVRNIQHGLYRVGFFLMPIGGFVLAAERLLAHMHGPAHSINDQAEVAWWAVYALAFGFLLLSGRTVPLLERALLVFMAAALLLLGTA